MYTKIYEVVMENLHSDRLSSDKLTKQVARCRPEGCHARIVNLTWMVGRMRLVMHARRAVVVLLQTVGFWTFLVTEWTITLSS